MTHVESARQRAGSAWRSATRAFALLSSRSGYIGIAVAAACGLAASRPARAQAAAEVPVKLAEFVVTPSRYGVAEQPTTAGATLTAAEIEARPQLGDDLYRSIARLPGLAADDFTAQFWVRGAPHGELLARLDGVELIEPFHLKDVDGALSIVDPQAISRLDLTTGGFTAEFGDKLAAVLTMETKSPAAPRTAVELSLSGVGAMHQGVTKDGRGGWLIAGRRGYPDVALRVAGRDDEVYPRYYDITAKFEYRLAPNHTVSAHALHAGDTLRYQRRNDPQLLSSYDSDYLWARWRGTIGSRVTGEAVLSAARLTWERNASGRLDGFPFALDDRRRLDVAALRQEWDVSLDERLLLRGGLEARTGAARYDYALARSYTAVEGGRQVTVPVNVNAALRPDGDNVGAFVSARTRPFAALVVEPGLRFDRHEHTDDREWSPRLNAALPLGRSTLRFAWGAYAQAQGWHELAVADGDQAFGSAERAEHRVVGFDHPFRGGLVVRVEAYERRSSRLRPRWENIDHGYDLFPEAQSDRVRLAPRRGRARGVEAMLSGRQGTTLSWTASYALAEAEEMLAARWVPRAREQRHTLHLNATYAPNARWQFSAAWQYHTGWPTSDVVYSLEPLTNGRRVLVSANGPVYGLRLPAYHRLDLRATRRFVLRRGELRVFVDVFNAYDRVNLVGYSHNVSVSGAQVAATRKPREQLPLLPSAGASWEF